MRSLASYLIIIFAAMFWVFRIFVTLLTSLGQEFPIVPMNMTIEIVLLFVTLISLVLVIKRNLFGAILYFASYLLYFGTELFNSVTNIPQDITLSSATTITGILVPAVAIILSFMVLGDVMLNKSRQANKTGDKKTDWYYKNASYDRQLDDRADKNNYRTL